MKYILFILALLVSCKAPLKVTDNQEIKATDKTQVATTHVEGGSAKVELSISKVTKEKEITVIKSTKREYDTDKPVDPSTGRHPLKSETNSQQTTTKVSEEQEQSEVIASDTTHVEQADNSKLDIQLEAEIQHSEKKQLPNIVWWAISIVSVGLIILAFWGKVSSWFKRLFTK